MKRLLPGLLSLLLLGSVGFGLSQLRAVRRLEENLAAREKDRLALENRLSELQKRSRELETRGPAPVFTASAEAPSPDEAASPFSGPPGMNPTSRNPRDRLRGDAGRFEAMMANPEIQQLMALGQKSRLDGRYADLFKRLQLSPADLEKFKALLVEKEAAMSDVSVAARNAGLNGRENRDEMRQLVAQTQAEVDSTIRATFGESVYAQYQGYETTRAERSVVGQLEQRLSYSSAPLTDQQSEYLVQILSTTANSSTSSASNSRGGPTPITSEAITRAQGVLSAAQITALESLQREQLAAAQLQQKMRANFRAGDASNSPRPGG